MGHMLKSRLPASSFANEKQEWQLNGEDMTIDHIAIPRAPTRIPSYETTRQFLSSKYHPLHNKAPKIDLWYITCVTQPASSSAQGVSQLNVTYHKKILEELHHKRFTFTFPSSDTHQRTQVSQESCREEAKQKLCTCRGSSSKPTTGQENPTLPHLQLSVPTPRTMGWSQQLLFWLCTRRNTREPFFRQEFTIQFHFNR